jgi:hypothetical protein
MNSRSGTQPAHRTAKILRKPGLSTDSQSFDLIGSALLFFHEQDKLICVESGIQIQLQLVDCPLAVGRKK